LAKLVINPTSPSKKEIPIASRVISIGRDPSNDLVLSDSMVSRRHAILEQRDDIFILRDNGSANGTMVNGDPVESEQTLRDGDLVAIGSSRLLFQLEEVRRRAAESEDVEESSGVVGDAALADKPGGPGPPGGKCPSCDAGTMESDRFCRSCGFELVKKTSLTCTACGHDVPLPAEFCGRCGHELPKRARGVPATRSHMASELLPRAPELERKARARAGASPLGRPRPPVPGSTAAKGGEPAGFGIRLVAAIVDNTILGIPLLMATLLWVTFGTSGAGPRAVPIRSVFMIWIVFNVFCLSYYLWFWAARGATPGKSLLGLVVRTETGETPIGFKRAVLRMVGYLASSLILGLGFAMIAFSDDKRGLHDRIAGTRVTRNP